MEEGKDPKKPRETEGDKGMKEIEIKKKSLMQDSAE